MEWKPGKSTELHQQRHLILPCSRHPHPSGGSENNGNDAEVPERKQRYRWHTRTTRPLWRGDLDTIHGETEICTGDAPYRTSCMQALDTGLQGGLQTASARYVLWYCSTLVWGKIGHEGYLLSAALRRISAPSLLGDVGTGALHDVVCAQVAGLDHARVLKTWNGVIHHVCPDRSKTTLIFLQSTDELVRVVLDSAVVYAVHGVTLEHRQHAKTTTTKGRVTRVSVQKHRRTDGAELYVEGRCIRADQRKQG